MRKGVIGCTILLILGLISGCAAQSTASKASLASASSSVSSSVSSSDVSSTISHIKTDTFKGPSLEKSLSGEKDERDLTIYLPSSYSSGNKSYPVVYYLHGFGDTSNQFLSGAVADLNAAFKNGEKEFIIVGVDGNTTSGGSFYVNSPVTGNFEDYIVKDVVSYVDSHYRTIPNAASRGIMGFSMGGFGSTYLALRHPDVYGAVYSMSPGVAKTESFNDVLKSWVGDSAVQRAYGQAFAPDPTGKFPYCKTPADGAAVSDPVMQQWIDGYANWDKKVADYMGKSAKLKAIGFSYGTSDSYSWIPEGTEYVIGLLKAQGITPDVYTFSGGHEIASDAVSKHIVPFFQQNLVWPS